MSKHSLGPWRVEDGYVVDAKGDEVANPVGDHECLEADARLIAAAPDLLGFLRRACDGGTGYPGWVPDCRNLLRLIDGE